MDDNNKPKKPIREIYKLAEKKGIPKSTMRSREVAGVPEDKLGERHLNREFVIIDGVRYESISEAVRQTEWKETTIRRYRGEDGVFRYEPKAAPAVKTIFQGKEYSDINAVAVMLGVPQTTFRNWLKAGLTEDEILEKVAKRKAKATQKLKK